jgi:hypothetical protein
MRPAPASALFGPDPAQPAPLANGELGLADDRGEFVGRVEILDRSPLHQGGQHPFDPIQPRVELHVHRRPRPFICVTTGVRRLNT